MSNTNNLFFNSFKPIPYQDLPFLNAWRDKLIMEAINLKIPIGPRETIDFEELFNEIRKKYSLKAENHKQQTPVNVWTKIKTMLNYNNIIKLGEL